MEQAVTRCREQVQRPLTGAMEPPGAEKLANYFLESEITPLLDILPGVDSSPVFLFRDDTLREGRSPSWELPEFIDHMENETVLVNILALKDGKVPAGISSHPSLILMPPTRRAGKLLDRSFPEVPRAASLGEAFFFYFLFRSGLLGLRSRFPYDLLVVPEIIGFSRFATGAMISEASKRDISMIVSNLSSGTTEERMLELGSRAVAVNHVINPDSIS
jgi:hypothetical protein